MLIVEDGTGKVDAQSFVSVANADTFFTARDPSGELFSAWTDKSVTEKEALLIRGTEGLENWFRGRWKGKKKTSTQALSWPRLEVKDEDVLDVADNIVPNPVKLATYYVSFIEITERYIQNAVSRKNMVQSESVGPISRTFMSGATAMKIYPHVDAILRGLAAAGGVQLGFNMGLTKDEAKGNTVVDVFDFPQYFQLIKS